MPFRPAITAERNSIAKRDRSLPPEIEAIGKAAHHLVGSDDPAVRGVGEALATWLENGAQTPLDMQLGLRRHGGVSLARALVLSDRNAQLRELWRSLPAWAELPPVAAAPVMALSARRYEADRWPRERHNQDAPSAEPAATWWRCLSLGVGIPDAKRIGQILSE